MDDKFHERLEGLLVSGQFPSNAELARYLSKRLDYDVDASTISNLRRRAYPTSRLAGPICIVFGWPFPPCSSVDEEVREPVSELLEVMMNGGASSEDVRGYLRAAVDAARRYRKLIPPKDDVGDT